MLRRGTQCVLQRYVESSSSNGIIYHYHITVSSSSHATGHRLWSIYVTTTPVGNLTYPHNVWWASFLHSGTSFYHDHGRMVGCPTSRRRPMMALKSHPPPARHSILSPSSYDDRNEGPLFWSGWSGTIP